jgi:hypothetical protein
MANANSQLTPVLNGNKPESELFEQGCGKFSNALVLRPDVASRMFVKLVTSLDKLPDMCSYDVFNKLTALIITGVRIFKTIKNY